MKTIDVLNKIGGLSKLKKNNLLDINIKLDKGAVMPTYAKDGDAGLDMTAISVKREEDILTYGTGVHVEIPFGYVGLVFPRSSISKKDMSLTNCVGVIDSGYRGEIMAKFRVENPFESSLDETYLNFYNTGERMLQMIIMPYPQVNLIQVNELSDSERGKGGYGSTGK